MKTFREIAEMHYASEPSNVFDKQYRQNRINALEKLLTEQLRIHDVVGRSEQLCDHPRSERSYIGQNMLRCNKCGKEFS